METFYELKDYLAQVSLPEALRTLSPAIAKHWDVLERHRGIDIRISHSRIVNVNWHSAGNKEFSIDARAYDLLKNGRK